MSIFDDVVHGLEEVSKTVTETASEALDEFRSLPSTALGIVQEMRTVATALPAGFPIVDILGGVDPTELIGSAPGAIPTLKGGAFDLARGVSEVALNPQPLPPGPDDYIPVMHTRGDGQGSSVIGSVLQSIGNQADTQSQPSEHIPSNIGALAAAMQRARLNQAILKSAPANEQTSFRSVARELQDQQLRMNSIVRGFSDGTSRTTPSPVDPIENQPESTSQEETPYTVLPETEEDAVVENLNSNAGDQWMYQAPEEEEIIAEWRPLEEDDEMQPEATEDAEELNPQPLPPAPEPDELQLPSAVVNAPILQGADLARILGRVNRF